MISKVQITNKLQELKPTLQADYSVKEIGLFGSFSDNTFNEDSDIDILFELYQPIGWKFFSLEIYLEKAFGRKIDLVTKGVRNFEIIDEASKKIPKLVKEKYPQIPWEEMYYLRNKVSHEYHGID
jgi:hypothetical protein